MVDEDDDREDYDEVEDPEALRRAEAAVARDQPEPETPEAPSDEHWTAVATEDLPRTAGVALAEIAALLEAAGVDHGWEPYDPVHVPFDPYPVSQPRFSVSVPESLLERARAVLPGVPPAGVAYGASIEPGNPDRMAPQAAPMGAESPRFASGPVSTPVTSWGQGPALSDNARLEAATRPHAWTTFATGIAIIIVILVVVLVLLVTKG